MQKGRETNISKVVISEYKGSPTISLPLNTVDREGNEKMFTFGVKKAQAILGEEVMRAVEEIKIAQHAIDRFVERSKKLGQGIPRDPEATIKKLLSEAKSEAVDPMHHVRRLISNGFEEVQYLVAQGWRLVLTKDGGRVITIERVVTHQN